MAPDQAPTSYLEHACASHLSSGVPSESGLPAVAELMACHDIVHPVTLTFTHSSALLLDTSVPSHTDPIVSHLLCQTIGKTCISKKPPDPSSCLLGEGDGTIFLPNIYFFFLCLL